MSIVWYVGTGTILLVQENMYLSKNVSIRLSPQRLSGSFWNVSTYQGCLERLEFQIQEKETVA